MRSIKGFPVIEILTTFAIIVIVTSILFNFLSGNQQYRQDGGIETNIDGHKFIKYQEYGATPVLIHSPECSACKGRIEK